MIRTEMENALGQKKLHKSLLSISNSRIIVGEHFRWKYILFGNRYLSVSLLVPRNREILVDDSTCSNRVPGFKHEASFPHSSKNPVEQRAERSALSRPLFSFIRESREAEHTYVHAYRRICTHTTAGWHRREQTAEKWSRSLLFRISGRISEAAVVWLGEHSCDMSP